jgi:photosystem II stability/assembly factor-like uncharacterized protein
MKSEDDGLHWMSLEIPNGATPTVVRANPANGKTVFVGCGAFGTVSLGVYKSIDGGIHWQQMLADSSIPVTAIDISSVDTSRVLLGTPGRVFQSTNSGNDWETLLSLEGSTHFETTIIRVSEVHPEKIFIGVTSNWTYDAGVYATSDNGYHWERRVNGLTEGLEYTGITALALDPINDSIIYMGNSVGVFKSTTAGSLWTSCGLPDLRGIGFINDVQIAPDDPTHVFATVRGTLVGRGGFYHSRNAGLTWDEIIIPGLSDKSRTFLEVVPQNESYSIHLGTESYGWLVGEVPRYTASVALEKGVPLVVHLEQNYPNPFNPSTTIRYGLPVRSHVTLVVVNTLGQQVAVLQNREQEAGYHDVKFDGSGFSSGVYFYRIQAGSFVQARKLLILR